MSSSLTAARAPERDAPPVLDLVRERVVLRARRRLAWLRHVDAACDGDPLARLDLDSLAEEHRFYAGREELAALGRRLADVEAELVAGVESRQRQSVLFHLVRLLDLAPAELDVLQAGIALELVPALGPAYHRLTGLVGVSEELVRGLFGHPIGPLLHADGGLLRWRLVAVRDVGPGAPNLLQIDPQITTWLSGHIPIDPSIHPYVRAVRAHEPLDAWPTRTTAEAIHALLDGGAAVRLVVAGHSGSGRRTFAAAVLRAVGADCFDVDLAAIPEAERSEAVLRVVRYARLASAAPITDRKLEGIESDLVNQLFLTVLVCAAHERPAPVEHAIDVRVELPTPDLDERAALWRRLVPAARTWPNEHVLEISRRYSPPIGDLAAVGLQRPATVDAAAELCRERSRHRLGELGQVLRCPFRADDLVIPSRLREHLDELVFEARDRVDFWRRPEARRLYPRGTGLVALFTGTAGTGKTMAAQVVAAELGLDLVRIDLASLVSKYIGETAKNLRRIFGAAAGMSAVLLFDEADALFAKRTDVRDSHDRHANADTNYLLQLLEDFAGVAVLASNKKANIDPAFTRRIRHVLDFPRPDVAGRRLLWQQILGELGADVAGLPLDLLAALDLSGAQIKNAVLAATFVARSERRSLTAAHLARGLDRELEKDGRSIDRRERERLIGHG